MTAAQRCALALVLPLWAAGSAALAADVNAGRVKAQACVVCHGEGGRSSNPAVPSLAAQPPLYIYYQLLQFRDERRKSPAMSPAAVGMKDAEMRDLAAYFAAEAPARNKQADKQATKPEALAAAEKIARQYYCASCHMPDYSGQKHIARLAGLNSEYLARQLRGFRNGERPDIDGTMASAAQPLSDQDIELLANYLAAFELPQ